MPRKISLSVVAIIIILAATVVITLIQFGNLSIAQGQGNLTAQQKAAICNPNNPKLKVVNTTESKLCGIPVTVKPHLSNTTSAANNTTTTGAPSGSLAPSSTPSPTG